MDNRVNSGVPDEIVVSQGLPAGAGQGIYEEACYTCSHCQRVVVKNRERTRPRGFCKKCNHILCDGCDAEYHASGHRCMPVVAFQNELRDAIERGSTNPLADAEAFFNILTK